MPYKQAPNPLTITTKQVVPCEEQTMHELTVTMAKLLLKQRGFAVILMQLVDKVTFTESIPTAGTDGASLFINPEYFFERTPSERIFLLCHELLHVVYHHAKRAAGYREITYGPDGNPFNRLKWNYAGDYYINKILDESKVGTFIQGGMFNPNIDTDKDSIDSIYLTLPDPPEGGAGDGPVGVHILPDETTNTPSTQKTGRALESAAAAEKAAGRGAGTFSRMAQDILAPKKDWKELLRSAMVTLIGSDEMSFSKINRRYLALPPRICMPDPVGHACNAVGIVIDTSGSVGQAEADAFINEVAGILDDAKPAATKLFFCDTTVHGVEPIENMDELRKVKWRSGGGTDMEAAWPVVAEHMADEGEYMIICLTDGFCYTYKSNEPPADVIWVTTSNEDLAYGTVIKLEL